MSDIAIRGSEAGAGRRWVVVWLFAVAALVFVMVVVGGITRLTESGLSMVEWQPATGWLPPLSEEAWQAEFEKYQAFPQYQQVNRGMALDEFKAIYAWEYGHRLLGRLIGLAFFVPFVAFLAMGRIRRAEVPWFLFLFVAGGAQGALGWFMVQSGLIDRPDVSQYRLAAHLGLAFAILGLLLWTGWRLAEEGRSRAAERTLRWPATLLGVAVFLQIIAGAFVAGTNAGFIYNTWPLIDGALIPSGLFDFEPAWLAPFEEHLTVQFVHRMIAYLVVGLALWAMLRARRASSAAARRAGTAVLHAVLLQVAIGIATLLAVVPVWLGALHQAIALVVWAAALYLARLSWTDAGRYR